MNQRISCQKNDASDKSQSNRSCVHVMIELKEESMDVGSDHVVEGQIFEGKYC
jgi:hypothetical protein